MHGFEHHGVFKGLACKARGATIFKYAVIKSQKEATLLVQSASNTYRGRVSVQQVFCTLEFI
jgi:hypothetical protein